MGNFIRTDNRHEFEPKPFPVITGKNDKFHFGLELEYLLAKKEATLKPLWYNDLSFHHLNQILECIDLTNFNQQFNHKMATLELETPHTKLMPYLVEGYHIPNEKFEMVDILPKGIEIRTPVCDSIRECLSSASDLYTLLKNELGKESMGLCALSHHPLFDTFHGTPNKRRFDYWQWSMGAMTTYGPDINISVPDELLVNFDRDDFDLKINYYAPAMTALSLNSPFCEGKLWTHQGKIGKSYRTFKRSTFAPPIEYHGNEGNRFEFKTFDMAPALEDYNLYFLLVLTLILDKDLKGRNSNFARIYGLGEVSLNGLDSYQVAETLSELQASCARTLPQFGFDLAPLNKLEAVLSSKKVAADYLIEMYQNGGMDKVYQSIFNRN